MVTTASLGRLSVAMKENNRWWKTRRRRRGRGATRGKNTAWDNLHPFLCRTPFLSCSTMPSVAWHFYKLFLLFFASVAFKVNYGSGLHTDLQGQSVRGRERERQSL